jgi:hypothetical protein
MERWIGGYRRHDAVADLDAFRSRRHDLIGGVIHEYVQVA